MKKKIDIENRKSTFVDLEDFCHHSLGDRKGKGDFFHKMKVKYYLPIHHTLL